jgi:electron transport complex protein RnfA
MRLEENDMPKSFKGAVIALITAALMSMAFMGYSGIIK